MVISVLSSVVESATIRHKGLNGGQVSKCAFSCLVEEREDAWLDQLEGILLALEL